MGSLTTLLREAAAAGLTLRADGDKLKIVGPKSAAETVRKLLANKPAVMAALTEGCESAAVAERSGDKVPTVQAVADRPVAADVARRFSGPDALTLTEVEAVVVQLDERAAIRQFDGNQPEAEAERSAVSELIKAGRLWRPEAWAQELRRRASIIGDAATAARFTRAVTVLANYIDHECES